VHEKKSKIIFKKKKTTKNKFSFEQIPNTKKSLKKMSCPSHNIQKNFSHYFAPFKQQQQQQQQQQLLQLSRKYFSDSKSDKTKHLTLQPAQPVR
jgi:hypothetical protein